jgi:hypothetical protein
MDISKIKTRNVALIAFGIFVVVLAIQKPNGISNKPVAQTAAPTPTLTPAPSPTPALAEEAKPSEPSATLGPVAVKPTATPATIATATPDPMRTKPTEEDKAKAREIARQIARGRMVKVAEDVDVRKAMERSSKHGTGATIEEETAAFAESDYPDNEALREWFCDYVPPVVKRIMIATRGVAEKHGANGVRHYFMILKDHPEDLKAWAFEAHHGALGALEDPLANSEAFDYLAYKWLNSYIGGRENEYKNKSQAEWLADLKESCFSDAEEAYPKNPAKRKELGDKLYKAVYDALEKRGLIKKS